MTDSRNLLHSLINAAEKAANIARLCRSNDQLLALLVQEKTGKEANARFEHDFKTLADVLIQETIKHDVGGEFPEMLENIQGEESPSFANATGKAVSICVGATEEETTACLLQVLESEYEDAAKALAAEVHRVVEFHKEIHEDLPQLPEMDYEQFGIWIDPIDATAEYISGDTIFTNFPGITSTGLDCVTVLIGVFERVTGVPVLGIISQPFGNKIEENIYTSSLYWGIALPDLKAHSKHLNTVPTHEGLMAIFSSSEYAGLLLKMSDLGYAFAFSAGAGHKALKVITGEVDVYVLSRGSTYKWDTCAPQAILRSLNGDMFDFISSITKREPIPLTYIPDDDSTDDNWRCNKGIIALRNLDLMHDILKKFEMS